MVVSCVSETSIPLSETIFLTVNYAMSLFFVDITLCDC